ncbi:MAG: hypothetical protein DLM70_01810 [Chloroflexi bacterium]|nr:MAG: hypothetical protein DLM70_01810 [Chloroflexota bacterium]
MSGTPSWFATYYYGNVSRANFEGQDASGCPYGQTNLGAYRNWESQAMNPPPTPTPNPSPPPDNPCFGNGGPVACVNVPGLDPLPGPFPVPEPIFIPVPA